MSLCSGVVADHDGASVEVRAEGDASALEEALDAWRVAQYALRDAIEADVAERLTVCRYGTHSFDLLA